MSIDINSSTMDLCPDVLDPVYPATPIYTFSFAPDAMSIDINTADPCPNVPDPVYPPTATHTFTFEHSGVAQAPQNSPALDYGFFRVYRTLGQGGFAKAMLAQSIEPNRLFCLKVFQKDQLKDMEHIIMDELAVYKRIATLIPCPARDFLMGLELSFQTKNDICFAMDLMAGDLSNYMKDRSSDCSKHALRWTAQIALGIYTLHEIGIMHRDIKAENILIDVRENVRIADYGLCYVHEDESPLDRGRVYTTSAVGTTYCMSPEILQNVIDPDSMEYGTPVDWWSFGCVVYQLFSENHKALFYTMDDISNYIAWCSDDDRPSRRHSNFENFPRLIADLLSGLLDIDPSTRYGFNQVVCNDAFVCGFEKTLFTEVYTHAQEREDLPDSLPTLQYNEPSEVWACLLPWDIQRVPNVDWVKPNYKQ
ncbi:kinase-like domain-containing protein [Suillus occidentalis]|nr:kinase-like domain-containing protein [Suillus occidentalis]